MSRLDVLARAAAERLVARKILSPDKEFIEALSCELAGLFIEQVGDRNCGRCWLGLRRQNLRREEPDYCEQKSRAEHKADFPPRDSHLSKKHVVQNGAILQSDCDMQDSVD
jgi:hypothetical protein